MHPGQYGPEYGRPRFSSELLSPPPPGMIIEPGVVPSKVSGQYRMAQGQMIHPDPEGAIRRSYHSVNVDGRLGVDFVYGVNAGILLTFNEQNHDPQHTALCVTNSRGEALLLVAAKPTGRNNEERRFLLYPGSANRQANQQRAQAGQPPDLTVGFMLMPAQLENLTFEIGKATALGGGDTGQVANVVAWNSLAPRLGPYAPVRPVGVLASFLMSCGIHPRDPRFKDL